MAEITISGYTVLVDDEDVERISQYNWFPKLCKNNNVYFHANLPRNNGKQPHIHLHRFIMGCSIGDGNIIDHINRNTLDNRKSNLRFATSSENRRNSRTRSDNTSGYKGVSYCKRDKTYKVDVVYLENGIAYSYKASSKNLEDAAHMYDKLAIKFYREFASTNFPVNTYTPDGIEEFYNKVMEKRNIQHTSKYRGVFWHKQSSSWRAVIKQNNKGIHLGNFHSELEAARAYDKKARSLLGDKAVLNFPEENR